MSKGVKVSEVQVAFIAEGVEQMTAAFQKILKEQGLLQQKSQEINQQSANSMGRLGGAFQRLGSTMGQLGGPLGQAGSLVSDLGGKIQGMGDIAESVGGQATGALAGIPKGAAAAAVAIGGLVVAYKALEKAEETARAGAAIERQKAKFDNLARSINTTADALLSDLKAATRGTVDDMELMTGASELISLKLVKNHEDAVRLTSVAGALGWNMNQLTLTISNLSTMRLDSLGLSVEAVVPRFNELKDAGMEAHDAMTLALIEAGEAVQALHGHVADSAEGVWRQLDATKTNVKNLFSELMEKRFRWVAEIKLDLAQGVEQELQRKLEGEEAKDRALELLRNDFYGNEQAKQAFLDYLYARRREHESFMAVIGGTVETEASIIRQFEGGGLSSFMQGFALDYFEKFPETLTIIEEATRQQTASMQEQGYVLDENMLRFVELERAQALAAQGIRGDLLSAYQELENAQLTLDMAVGEFNISMGDDLYKSLEKSGLSVDEIRRRLTVLSEVTGKDYVMQFDFATRMDAMTEYILSDDFDEETFRSKFGDMSDLFSPLSAGVRKAQEEVDILQKKINDLEKQYDVIINLRVNGSLPPTHGASGGFYVPPAGASVTPQALGGPVYQNEPYLVGEHGPELFIPSVTGQIVPNWQISSTANVDSEELAAAMEVAFERAMAKRDLRAGVQAQPLRSAFENVRNW